jgi:hypothetical protein
MSSYKHFSILPFDPLITPIPKISLPIDWYDFQRQLQILCPEHEIRTGITDGEKYLHLITNEELEGSATWIEGYSDFNISYWPIPFSTRLVLWYRNYIPLSYPLYFLIPEDGYVAELTADLTLDDIEKMYPFPKSKG